MLFFSPEIWATLSVALDMLVKGLIGIFVVIGLIALVVYILTKIGSKKA
jgi:hypothetical protein